MLILSLANRHRLTHLAISDILLSMHLPKGSSQHLTGLRHKLSYLHGLGILGFCQISYSLTTAAKQQSALQRDSRSLDHHCSTFKRSFEYTGGEIKIGLKKPFLSSFFSYNELLTSIAHKLRQLSS